MKSTTITRTMMSLIISSLALVGCANINTTKSERTELKSSSTSVSLESTTTKETVTQSINNEISVQRFCILEGTQYESECFIFESSIEGPTIAIVGGIHGDERAGYMTAWKMIENTDGFRGKILIIPEASALACKICQRYPGVITSTGTYNGVGYSDLNRTFPGKEDGTITEKIAYAISSTVESMSPDFVVDLHESRHSYSYDKNGVNRYLGNEIICGNAKSMMAAYDICDIYNGKYKLDGEDPFCVDQSSPDGSFNNYFGTLYKKDLVFTIETNRELRIDRRVEQQMNLLSIMLEYFYNYK